MVVLGRQPARKMFLSRNRHSASTADSCQKRGEESRSPPPKKVSGKDSILLGLPQTLGVCLPAERVRGGKTHIHANCASLSTYTLLERHGSGEGVRCRGSGRSLQARGLRLWRACVGGISSGSHRSRRAVGATSLLTQGKEEQVTVLWKTNSRKVFPYGGLPTEGSEILRGNSIPSSSLSGK